MRPNKSSEPQPARSDAPTHPGLYPSMTGFEAETVATAKQQIVQFSCLIAGVGITVLVTTLPVLLYGSQSLENANLPVQNQPLNSSRPSAISINRQWLYTINGIKRSIER